MKRLLTDFDKISSKQWKQKIQMQLKGLEYNEVLVSESLEGIKIKPFYHTEDIVQNPVPYKNDDFLIQESIYVNIEETSNKNAKEKLATGTQIIQFDIDKSVDWQQLLEGLDNTNIRINFFKPDQQQIEECLKHGQQKMLIDPLGHLIKDGNWFDNQEKDIELLNKIQKSSIDSFLHIDNKTIQNSGANMTQQLAYTILHINYYLQKGFVDKPIQISMAVGKNYFFEIAKLRALRMLLQSLTEAYDNQPTFILKVVPTNRNKTLYDYNVNLLRTTTECMSAILGGADIVENLPYDSNYHKSNEFGDRIARNQLLIMKHEAYLSQNKNAADGAYYIEQITHELAQKALTLVKDIDLNGGFVKQLIDGTIQRKIKDSAQKEQNLYDNHQEVLLGTTKYPNPQDKMKNELELYPFVKTKARKTLISPIIPVRLSEQYEQERLKNE